MVQRSLSPPGGGNAVAAWMVHALAERHQVATLTFDAWSVDETNAFYGTSIPRSVTRLRPSALWRPLAWLPETMLTRLRMCAALRASRRLAQQFDLMVTADNFGVFAGPGIQYLHFPAPLQPPPARLAPIVNVYFRLCDAVLGAPWTDAIRNLTLVNSQWTADGLPAFGQIRSATVLYPPVIDTGRGLPWDQRDNTFLCVGRFTPTKRIEMAVAIVDRVRQHAMPDARLVIVGSVIDRQYAARIRTLAAGRSWVDIREDLSRDQLNALMQRSRYGIHAMFEEHFGMATAELTRAGCLVFGHNSGGTPEVLDHATELLWSTEDEAVERITSINPEPLRVRLREHAGQFSIEQFVARFQAIVEDYVSRRNSGSAMSS